MLFRSVRERRETGRLAGGAGLATRRPLVDRHANTSFRRGQRPSGYGASASAAAAPAEAAQEHGDHDAEDDAGDDPVS